MTKTNSHLTEMIDSWRNATQQMETPHSEPLPETPRSDKLLEGRVFGVITIPFSIVCRMAKDGGESLGLGKECGVEFELSECKGSHSLLLYSTIGSWDVLI